jgi:hypothetical protein
MGRICENYCNLDLFICSRSNIRADDSIHLGIDVPDSGKGLRLRTALTAK